MIDDRRITLRCYMNWLALQGLPPFPKGPLQAIVEAGYDGVQFTDPPNADVAQEARDLGLGVCGSGRVNKPEEAAVLARAAKAARLECPTLHVGWGLEDDSEADRLIEAVLDASTKYNIALYPETHRATIFQDMWRTVQSVRRYPSLRFNGDFSHWYTGLERVYGGFERKLDSIQPVIERVRFLHGRVGNPGCMQVDIGEGEVQQCPYLQHFSTLWTAVFTNFWRSASRGEYICFATELLGPNIYYARTFRGCEESDRWRQSQVLVRIARECFVHARKLAYGGNQTCDASFRYFAERPMTAKEFNQGYLWGISLAAALGGLLFGYDWVAIGGAKPFYEPYFQVFSPARQGWAMSCALVGCLLGSILSGLLSDRFGRKRMLIFAGLAFALSSLGTGLATSFPEFVLWRMAGGIGIGLASSLSPMYIAEVAPAELRGRLVAMYQLAIVLGIVLAQVMNWLIARPLAPGATWIQMRESWDGQLGWRWMFGVTAIPAGLFLLALLVVPESPRWLAKKGQTERSLRILSRIGGEQYGAQVVAEVEETLNARASELRLREFLKSPTLRPLLLGIGLAILQQWCGINVIFNYAQEVFTTAGYSVSSLLFNIVVTGFVMLLFTVVAINTFDRQGRRALMLTGCGGLALLYVCLGYAFHFYVHGFAILLLVAAAIGCYAMTLAPVTWVLLSEIFPNRVRSMAMSVATTFLWAACFVLTYTFPTLNRGLGSAKTFWLYAVICAGGFAMVSKWVPETKGRTLEEIEAFWK